jgi:hypothetical protein
MPSRSQQQSFNDPVDLCAIPAGVITGDRLPVRKSHSIIVCKPTGIVCGDLGQDRNPAPCPTIGQGFRKQRPTRA